MAATTEPATKVSTPLTGTDKVLSFETGLLAQQSQGAVVGRIGEQSAHRHSQSAGRRLAREDCDRARRESQQVVGHGRGCR